MVYQAYGGMNSSNNMSGDQNRKIFLGGLNYHTTDETLRAFCSRFGKITDCLVMRNPEGKSRGFGFVTYEDTQSVEDFMRARPHTIDNRQIDPKRAMPREEQNSSEAHLTVKKLFVAGLREGINEENLRAHFSRFGNIVEILIMKDREGKPRGFAFVTYDDYDAVDKAVLEKPHVINGRNLDVKKAVPKEKMQDSSGLDSSPSASGGMPSYNRNSSSNYPSTNMGGGGSGGPPPSNPQRSNYGQIRDNFNSSPNNWGNNQGGGGGGMTRMNNQNQNYNQPPASSYGPQGGYNTNVSSYNQSMPPTNTYSQQYNPMGQNQPPPPPPPTMPQQQSSMMNYDMYSNNNPNMPFNNQPPPPSSSNYMQPPPPQTYGQNQQQGYGSNSNNFGGMNNPFNLPAPPSSVGSGGYNNLSSTASPFDNSSSYGIIPQNYGGGAGAGGNAAGNYNNMPPQQSRGGGPIHGGKNGGNNKYGGQSGNEGNYGNRPAPYPSRGGGRGGSRGGRGRGRAQ